MFNTVKSRQARKYLFIYLFIEKQGGGRRYCAIKKQISAEKKKKNCFKYFVHLDNPRRSHMAYEQVLTERSLIK